MINISFTSCYFVTAIVSKPTSLLISSAPNTLKCLSIGTPKIIKFVLNLKLVIFGCPKIWAHYSLIIMCSNI